MKQTSPCVQRSNCFCHSRTNLTISKLLVQKIASSKPVQACPDLRLQCRPIQKKKQSVAFERLPLPISLRISVIVRPNSSDNSQLAKASMEIAAVQQISIRRKSAGNIQLRIQRGFPWNPLFAKIYGIAKVSPTNPYFRGSDSIHYSFSLRKSNLDVRKYSKGAYSRK